MRRIVGIALFLSAALLLAAPVHGQIENEDPGGVDLARIPPRIIGNEDPVPFPVPIAPLTPASGVESNELQLVGFTEDLFGGNAGVLNMSIGCQFVFPGSRMCTLEEVNKSLFIPRSLGHGYAWVQNLAERGGTPELNCMGWMSVSPDEQGTSIELGECYGGLMMHSCDTRLAVACCARMSPLEPR
jgi:hypothetical protein